MKIEDRLLKFPRWLPNDLEGFIYIYPDKYPPIVKEFEDIALKIAGDPEEFRKYASRLSPENRQHGWGNHYLLSPEEIHDVYAEEAFYLLLVLLAAGPWRQ